MKTYTIYRIEDCETQVGPYNHSCNADDELLGLDNMAIEHEDDGEHPSMVNDFDDWGFEWLLG